ncbi:hypothetical protein JYU15_02420 [bacterium AH-315-I18]|nr:hypothetical protein [bacterium AH-315-I18]
MSQRQLACQFGVDSSTVLHWEKGWHRPTGESIRLLGSIGLWLEAGA